MRRTIWTNLFMAMICLGAGVARSAPAPKPPPEPLPTAEDIGQLLTNEKYTDVVRSVSRLTTSREWQAKKENAYELYTMKGEAHLHLKETALAATTFDLAAKAALEQYTIDKAAADKAAEEKVDEDLDVKVSKDREMVGLARATAYLIRHSTGTFFLPKATANQRVPGKSPDDHVKIDIVNPDTRKQALTAVWTDAKNAAAAKIDAASNLDNKSPAIVMESAAFIPNIRDLDYAANGSDEDTQKIAQSIADHGKDVFQAMIDKYVQRLDIISADAMSVTMQRSNLQSGGYADRWHRRGLENNQPKELKDMTKVTIQIGQAIKLLQDELECDRETFEGSERDVKNIQKRAEKLLKIDPSQTYATREAAMKS